MLKLLLLCLGTSGLLALSQRENPAQRINWGRSGHYIRQPMDAFLLIGIIWLTCFAFLRTDYNDTAAYIRGFREAQSLSEGFASGKYVDWIENPLSHFYQDLMRSITSNYHVYFLLPALLHSVALMKFCKRYSLDPGMSLLIYFSLGTYALMFLAAFKQGMAMAILLLALPYAQDKKYGTYVLLVLLAMLFHFYAVVYLVIPLLFGKPWGKTTWIMIGATAFTLVTYDSTLGVVMEYVDEMGGDIAAEELFDGNSINVLRVAVYWVPALLALVFKRYVNHNSTGTENLFVNMSVLCACIISIGLAEGANLYGRMAGYFEIAMAVSLPYIIRKIFNKGSAQLVSRAAMLLFLGYFCYEFTFSKNFTDGYRAITFGQFLLELIGLR